MRKLFTYLLFIVLTNTTMAQIESGLLFGLTKGTTSEIGAITGMEEGQILYNSDTKALLVYNGSTWVNTENSNWSLNGNATSIGTFLGTTNDVSMDLRSNNTSILQFGRRQTLGLTQNYADYTDNNQYMTYVRGNNGTSALQFQADAASFYKPMFFTTSQGNFRLKGSAAGTDFFEIGSAGVSNAGEVEFIIGDDGVEPFIFKRYDYRDQLLKELFRIQGASDSQNALPRVGINTGQVANSTLQINGSISNSIIRITSSITLTEEHHTVIMTGGRPDITLPSASSCMGRIYYIKNYCGRDTNISVYRDMRGRTSTDLDDEKGYIFQSDGVEWQQLLEE